MLVRLPIDGGTGGNGNGIGAGATVNSAVFAPTFRFDEDGIVQVGTITGGATIKVQGRLSQAAPWVDIVLTSAGATTATAAGYFLVPLFPEMRINVVAGGSGATLSVWFGD